MACHQFNGLSSIFNDFVSPVMAMHPSGGNFVLKNNLLGGQTNLLGGQHN
jgi:hypothetical protein